MRREFRISFFFTFLHYSWALDILETWLLSGCIHVVPCQYRRRSFFRVGRRSMGGDSNGWCRAAVLQTVHPVQAAPPLDHAPFSAAFQMHSDNGESGWWREECRDATVEENEGVRVRNISNRIFISPTLVGRWESTQNGETNTHIYNSWSFSYQLPSSL